MCIRDRCRDTQIGRKYAADVDSGAAGATQTWVNGYLNSFQAWSYAKNAFDKWSLQVAQRLGQLRNPQASSKSVSYTHLDVYKRQLQALRLRCPELKVIVLSVHDEQSVRRAAMEAGADAFVLKRAIASDLLNAVDAVRCGCHTGVSGEEWKPV